MASLLPRIAIIAPGAMGSAVAKRFTKAGCTVLTVLHGRSEATRRRALEAGMEDTSLADIARRAHWVLSILPPSDAFSFADKFAQIANAQNSQSRDTPLVFADCNAVNPETVKKISALFTNTDIAFIDAGIIGGPPGDNYDPTFYASADVKDGAVLDEFVALSKYGLKVSPLKGGAGVGDASALKMSYAVSKLYCPV